MSASLSRLLKDFSDPPTPALFDAGVPQATLIEVPQVVEEPVALEPVVPEVDIEAERKEAFEQGKAEGRAEMEAELRAQLQAEFDAKLAEKSTENDAAIEALKAESRDEIAKLTVDRIDALRDELTAFLSAQVLNALLPLAEERVVNGAIDVLTREVKALFEEEGATEITVHGKAEFASAFEEKINDGELKIRFRESDDSGLTVELGDKVIVARLSDWAEGVQELLK
jgi:hypothetical protein